MRHGHGLPPVDGRVEDVSPRVVGEEVRVVALTDELVLEGAADGAALALKHLLVRAVAAAI